MMLIQRIWTKVGEFFEQKYDLSLYQQGNLRFAYVVYTAYLNSTNYIMLSQSKNLMKEAHKGFKMAFDDECSYSAFEKSVYRTYNSLIENNPLDFITFVRELSNVIEI